MHLVYICYEFPVLTQTFTVAEARGLRELGVDLSVVSCRRPPGENRSGVPARALSSPLSLPVLCTFLLWLLRRPVRTLELLGTVASSSYRDQPFRCWARGFLQLLWGCRLADEIRRSGRRPHLHAQFVDAASTVAFTAARLADLTFSFTNHTAYNPYVLTPKMRRARLAVSISRFDRRLLRRMARGTGADRGRVVYQGIDLDAFPLRAPREPGGRGEVLSVAALRDKKGHDLLVEAVAILRDRGVEARLTIVGEGPERVRIETAILRHGLSERVRLVGAEPPEKVRERLMAADVFALGCRRAANGDLDGIPISLMEAMAVGVPVVSTRISGIPELVEDGIEGRLAPPDAPAALADRIEAALRDREETAAMTARAREKVERRHDLRRTTGDLLRALETAVNLPSSPGRGRGSAPRPPGR